MISIIIPTYNERENLEELFKRISRALEDRDFEIIIVDDDSPDKTWEKAEILGKIYPVRVIRRTKEKGLSSAVIRGFEEANGDIIVVMDADLQHPPEVIPKLIEAIEHGADISIASRYVKGGKVENWYWWRKIISKGAIMVGRVALPKIRNIKDPVSGFFALKKGVIAKTDLNSVGFKILLEILIKGQYERVVEIPFTFGLRRAGESKLSQKQIINYLKHIYRLMRWEGEIDRLIKFSFVGLSGIFVNEGALLGFVEFSLKTPKLPSCCSHWSSSTMGYLFNPPLHGASLFNCKPHRDWILFYSSVYLQSKHYMGMIRISLRRKKRINISAPKYKWRRT